VIASPPVRIGFCGDFQVGKSLLLNCLLGDNISLVGDLSPTTPFPVTYQWGAQAGAALINADGSTDREFCSPKLFVDFLKQEHATEEGKAHIRTYAGAQVTLPLLKLRQVALVDTPGFNDIETDARKATDAWRTLDFAIFVTTNYKELNPTERNVLRQMSVEGLPFVIVINCHHNGAGGPSPTAPVNSKLAGTTGDWARNHGIQIVRLAQQDVLLINVAWAWHAAANGRTVTKEIEEQRNEAVRQQFEDKVPEPEQLRKLSQVDKLSRFIFVRPEQIPGWNAPCFGALHREVREWVIQVREGLHQMRSLTYPIM
jgi:hypothetical protein